MTSAQASIAFDMAFSGPDDNMELGTSPLRQSDDVNFDDLDPMHDPFVDNSMLDEAEFVGDDPDLMQADLEHENEDDEMLDEALDRQSNHPLEADLDMTERVEVEDEEILYDEDEQDPATTAEEATDVTSPQVIEEAAEQHADEFVDVQAIQTADPPKASEGKPDDVREETTQDESLTDNESSENYQTSAQVQTQGQVTDSLNLQATASHDFAPDSTIGESGQPLHEIQELSTQHDQPTATEPAIPSGIAQNGDAELNQPENEGLAAHEPSTPHAENSVDRVKSGSTGDEVTTSETETGFQSVKLVYLGEEMSLFPPAEADATTTFFLQDGNLAHAPLDKLLVACREVLGESLGHEDELVLDIPLLGLHIYEDSKFASSLTLSQVTEVYVTLCLNERLDPIEPLYCILSSRVCVSTQFAYLSSAAGEGKHFSDIAADYVDTPEEATEHYDLAEENIDNAAHSASEQVENEPLRNESNSQEAENLGSKSTEEHHGEVNSTTQTKEEDSQLGEEHEPALYGDSKALVPEQPDSGTSNQDVTSKEAILEGIDHDLNNELLQSNSYDVGELQGQVYDGDDAHDFDDPDANTDSPHDDRTINSDNLGTNEVQADGEAQEQSYTEFPQPTDEVDIPAVDEDVLADLDTGIHNSTNDDTQQTMVDPVKKSSLHKTLGDNELALEGGNEDESVSVQAFEDVIEPESFPEDQEWNEPVADDQSPQTVENLNSIDDNNGSAPITPTKNSATKRKAVEDEDDLDFLDLSTPEPKRTRTSADGVV